MSQRADELAPSLAPDTSADLPGWLVALGRPAEWPRALAVVRPWEVLAWAAVLAVAATLRLAALGDLPLSPDEAMPAMEGWRLWLGRAPTDIEGAVLLTHSLLIAFGLLGASDLVARLPSALAGLALVIAPLLYRPLLGPVGALGTAAVLALSPIVVFGSRHVDSAIFVAAAIAWLVGVSLRAVSPPDPPMLGEEGRGEDRPPDPPMLGGEGPGMTGRPIVGNAAATHTSSSPQYWGAEGGTPAGEGNRWRYAVPVVAALLLCAGSVALPAALAVLVAALVTWWPSHATPATAEPATEQTPAAHPATPTTGRLATLVQGWGLLLGRLLPTPRWLALALFAGTLVLVGTAGLTHLRGLQAAVVDPWVSWVAPFHPHAVPVPWLPTLLLYDLPLVVAAIAGLVVVVRRNRPFEHFLLWWTTLGAVPLVFQPPDPLPLLICWTVPLALLGGVAFGSLAALGWTWRDGGKDALLATLLAIDILFLMNTLRLITSAAGTPGGIGGRARELAFSLIVLAILAVVHWRVAGWWREALRDVPGGARLSRIGAVGLIALGAAFMVLANDRVQFAHDGAGTAELLRPEALDHGVFEVADEALAWARQEPYQPIAVSTALRPILLWHLRDVAPVQFYDRPPEAVGASPIRRGIWPAGPDAPEGERRPLRETVTIGPIPSTGALWNWWVYRNAWLVPTRHDIIVVR